MRYLIPFCLALFIITSCNNKPTVDKAAAKAKINNVLDDWHNAAAEADFDRYFGHFANDSSIFMGTDASEYWTVPEFKDYARKPFAAGDAWSFAPVERHIYISESGKVAWFDESLDSPAFGITRGSGVVVKADTTWKIVHYNLSLPIPNAIVNDLVDQIKAEKKKQEKKNNK